MVTFVTLVGVFLVIALLRQHLPPVDNAGFSLSDLPHLRKRYTPAHILSVATFPLSLIGAFFAAAALVPVSKYGMETIMGITALAPFAVLNLVYFGLYKWKGEDWFTGFRTFLNMSYGYDYFRVVHVTTVIGAIAGLISLVYAAAR